MGIKGVSKITDEEIINKCKELGLEYVGRETIPRGIRVSYICPNHRDKGIINSMWHHLRTAKYGCKYCIGRGKTTDEFRSTLTRDDYDIISEYIGFEKPITCKCKICDNIWITTPQSLYQGCGCPECGKGAGGRARRKSHEQFVEEMKVENPNIKILGTYQTELTPIECECLLCGNVWSSKPIHLLWQHVMCPKCTASKMEVYLGNTLEELGFKNVMHHKRIEECKLSNTLEFDYIIYDDNNQILFACEYDGEQHFMPIDFAGKGKEWAEEQLRITQERDKAKNDFCKENNIILIRVPYWEKNNMLSYLKHQIKINNITQSLETAG